MQFARGAAAISAVLVLFVLASCTAFRVLTHETTVEPSKLVSGNYEIDPDHVSVIFKVDHFGFSNYVGRFNKVDAALDFDPAAPADSTLNVAIAAASVDSLNRFVNDQLKGPAMFDAEGHPQITFLSREIEIKSESAARVKGDLTLRGVTRPVTLDVVFNGGGTNPLTQRDTLGFSATTKFRRSEFGLGAWIPAVGDEVSVEIEAEFVRRSEA